MEPDIDSLDEYVVVASPPIEPEPTYAFADTVIERLDGDRYGFICQVKERATLTIVVEGEKEEVDRILNESKFGLLVQDLDQSIAVNVSDIRRRIHSSGSERDDADQQMYDELIGELERRICRGDLSLKQIDGVDLGLLVAAAEPPARPKPVQSRVSLTMNIDVRTKGDDDTMWAVVIDPTVSSGVHEYTVTSSRANVKVKCTSGNGVVADSDRGDAKTITPKPAPNNATKIGWNSPVGVRAANGSSTYTLYVNGVPRSNYS